MTNLYVVIFCHFIFLNSLTQKIVLTDESMLNCDAGTCDEGEFFDVQTRSCRPCSKGTYNDMRNHSCLSCKLCSEADHYDAEMVVENCTSTSDTGIVCKPGYFNAHDDVEFATDCEACSVCGENEVLLQACSNTSDTVCFRNTTKTEPIWESEPNTSLVKQLIITLSVSVVFVAVVSILIFILYKSRYRSMFNLKRIQNPFSQRSEIDVSFAKLEDEERNL